ncbi:response regulator [Deinococcus aetherius]|uniref:response regulator n=1 Tax=Deinococcus aetherius TaxID=200252 RepID=UPI0022325497|nr:response regulator [Deinococcus aetherius]
MSFFTRQGILKREGRHRAPCFLKGVRLSRHLLIVEDNAHDVELACAALELSNVQCKVSVARDGAEALDFLSRRGAYAGRPAGQPDLILLDLNMPRVNGHQVLCAIKGDAALREVPVVIFTTSNLSQDREACLACGADDYLLKPEGFAEFVTTINQLGRRWLTADRCA